MRTLLLVALACVLLGVAAPTAAAHVTIGIDFSGDGRCDDPGETITIPTPDPIHRHGPCNV